MIDRADPARAPLRAAHRVRAVGNVINLSSVLGLIAARAGGARLRPGPKGLLLAEGYTLDFPRAGAFTLGNVVLTGGTFASLTERQPAVLDHENAHAWQYLCCAGLPFLPLYALAAGWSWLRTGDVASANLFERAAGLERGGYREAPVTNLGFRRLARQAQTLMLKPSRFADRSF